MAVTLGQTTRLTLITVPTETVLIESWDPTTSTWLAQSKTAVPSTMQLCTPQSGPVLTTVVPSCPVTGTNVLCFYPERPRRPAYRHPLPDDQPGERHGATVYFETVAADHKFKVVVWGLTGMTKLIDQW